MIAAMSDRGHERASHTRKRDARLSDHGGRAHAAAQEAVRIHSR